MASETQRPEKKQATTKQKPKPKVKSAEKQATQVAPTAILHRAATTHPSLLSRADLMSLQQTVGNRAVRSVLTKKSKPNIPARTELTGETAGSQRKQEVDGVPLGVKGTAILDKQSTVQRATDGAQKPDARFKREKETEAELLTPDTGILEYAARRENRTGLPDNLKAGVEKLSGISMDNVKVHYNSSKPALLKSLAYTKGTDIHIAPGQEQHLPHEAWHVAQQKQRRVKPTLQAKGVAINHDEKLEKEADVMGARAAQAGRQGSQRKEKRNSGPVNHHSSPVAATLFGPAVRQSRKPAVAAGNGKASQSSRVKKTVKNRRPGPKISRNVEPRQTLSPAISSNIAFDDVVQLALGWKVSPLFRAAHLKHPQIAGWAVYLGTDWNNAEQIYNLGVRIAAPDYNSFNNLITACGGAAAVNFVNLTALFQAIPQGANGTIANVTALITAGGAANLTHLTALVQAAGNNVTIPQITALVIATGGAATHFVNLTALVQAIGNNGTIAETIALIAAGGVANLTSLTALVQAAGNNGTIPQITALVIATGGEGTHFVNLTALVQAVGNNGTIVETTALIAAGGKDNLVHLTALVKAAPAVANAATNLTTLVNSVAGSGTIQETTALVTVAIKRHAQTTILEIDALVKEAKEHNNGTTVVQIDALVTAAPALANVVPHLTTLVKNVAKSGTIPQTTALVTSALGRHAQATVTQMDELVRKAKQYNNGTTVVEIDALVKAAPIAADVIAHLRRLLEEAKAKGTVPQTTTLITTVGVNGTILETTALVASALKHNNGTTVVQINALVTAAGNVANVSKDLTALVDAVQAKGTVPQTTALITTVGVNGTIAETAALVKAAIGHNKGTTVVELDALVQAAGNVADVCKDLTALVNAVKNNGKVPKITEMVTAATASFNAGHTNDLLPLINRNPGQNTPPRVRELILALSPNNLGRFNQIEPKIAWFTRQGAPVVAAAAYVRDGRNFSCNRWAYFYRRHSYEYYDFALTAANNSMWARNIGVGVQNNLAATIGALSPQQVTYLLSGGYQARSANNHEVGVADNTGQITHFMPVGGAVDDSFTEAEMDAIKNLR